MKVYKKHGKVTQNMHGESRKYRYVWDVSASWGEEELMKMASWAKALSGRVPEQDPGDPRSWVRWQRKSGTLLEKKDFDIRDFLRGG